MCHVRRCEEADCAAIVQLSQQWAAEQITRGYENVQWTEEKLRAQLNMQYACVAVDYTSVIGYAFGEVRQGHAQPAIPAEERYLELYELYVFPDYRAQGIGHKLVRHLLDVAHQAGIERALVGSSNFDWRRTASFYKDLGFQMWYIQLFR